jgi:hypothetical protein
MTSIAKAALLSFGLFLMCTSLKASAQIGPRAQSHPQPGLVSEGTNILMVFANPVVGKETEFNTWFNEHSQAILRSPGFVRCQRFKMMPRKDKVPPPYAYVILYEFTGDPDAVIAALGTAVNAGKLEMPDPRYVLKTESMVYQAIDSGFASK